MATHTNCLTHCCATPEIHAHIDGDKKARQFLVALSTHTSIGDDLYNLINLYTATPSSKHSAFIRGFLRRIQKELEAHA
jgi:hypothetical protein